VILLFFSEYKKRLNLCVELEGRRRGDKIRNFLFTYLTYCQVYCKSREKDKLIDVFFGMEVLFCDFCDAFDLFPLFGDLELPLPNGVFSFVVVDEF